MGVLLDKMPMSPIRSLLFALCIVILVLGAGCSTPCWEYAGEYRPGHITITGSQAVAVPFSAYECPGYNSDPGLMEQSPVVPLDSERELVLDVILQPGTSVELSFGAETVILDPPPAEGANSWSLRVPVTANEVNVRLCSEDDRCVLYEADLDSG